MSPKDQNERFSDEALDPAAQDFDDVVENHGANSGDEGADSGDEVARNLRNAEDGMTAPENFYEGDGKDAARRAEAKEWNAPENNLYTPEGEKQTLKARVGSKRRNKLIALGAGGGIAGIIISIVMLILPMKLPGVTGMLTREAGQRVEQITEKRAKVILARAILLKFAPNTGLVVTGKGTFHSLVASMRTASFEKKLADRGFEIKRGTGGVYLLMQGRDLQIVNGKPVHILYTDEMQIVRALDNNPDAKRLIDNIVREEIPAWRWHKRAKRYRRDFPSSSVQQTRNGNVYNSRYLL